MDNVEGVPGSALTRPCVGLEIPSGEQGLAVLMPALASAMNGAGPAIALLPGSGSPVYRARIQSAVQPGGAVAEEVAVVAPTSGSTGHPAGVLLPAPALRAAAIAFTARSAHPAGHQWVAALPLHHAGGLMVAVRSVQAGTTPVGVASLGGATRFTVEAFARATGDARARSRADGRPLAVSLVPAMLATLDEAGPTGWELLAHYDTVLVGGSAVPPALVGRLLRSGVRIATSYGMTETCGGAVFDGRPLSGVEVEADASGRLTISGTQVALGYRDGREQDRWSIGRDGRRRFRTDDIGYVDPDGSVRVLGRVDDVVQVAGTSVSLSAVRAHLAGDHRVTQAEVVALDDPARGSQLVAAVVPARAAHSGPDEALAEDLATAVEAALGRAARPRAVHVVPSLPTMESGKVDRQAVQVWAQGLAGSSR
jgi:O-succinylbenzoic acid--CoA ligase